MKFSHEFGTEQQAQEQEAVLKASGYPVWRTRKDDGTWEVYWWVRE